jgi:hypothetical protein
MGIARKGRRENREIVAALHPSYEVPRITLPFASPR